MAGVKPTNTSKSQDRRIAEQSRGLAIGTAGTGLAAGGPHGGLVERVEPQEQVGMSPPSEENWADGMAKHMLTPEEQEARAKELAAQNVSHGPGLAAQADPHVFVQFNATVMVHDTRGMEQLVDRVTVGKAVCDHGRNVVAIMLVAGWFEVWVEGEREGPSSFRVPVSNVRSARR